MRHGSLFSGIGGFDLAAEWMGWENVFHCEINEFCQKILKYHFPNSVGYADITKTDFSEWRGRCDIVTGGFPCQPYSQAGKRKGKADDRHLWPEMLRAIREIQPAWIVGENVPGLLNWKRGMVLAEIKADLEAAGFEVFPPVILPACGKNAPHRRDRLWLVAYGKNENGGLRIGEETQHPRFRFNGKNGTITNSNSHREGKVGGNIKKMCGLQVEESGTENSPTILSRNDQQNVTDTEAERLQKWNGEQVWNGSHTAIKRHSSPLNWRDFPIESPIRIRNDGLSCELDGITISAHRTKSIEGAGNAIVPQVVYEIFKAIEMLNSDTNVKER